MTKFLPQQTNSILVEAWNAFKVSSGKVIRDRFLKIKLPPLITPELTTNTQACDAFIQVSSGAKAKEINNISRRTVAPIEVKETRTDANMLVLREKNSKQSSRNISLRAAAYGAARKLTIVLIQEMKR